MLYCFFFFFWVFIIFPRSPLNDYSKQRLTDSSYDTTNQAEEIGVPGHWVRLLGVRCGQCRHNGDTEWHHSEGYRCSK